MTHHRGLNGRSIHTISRFTALEGLNSCHRRPSPLQGPCLVRLPTSFISAYPLYSQSSTLVLVHLGHNCLWCGAVTLSSIYHVHYIPFLFRFSVPHPCSGCDNGNYFLFLDFARASGGLARNDNDFLLITMMLDPSL